MEISKRYNSVPVKELRAVCTYLPILGPGYPTVSLKFSPANPCCHGNEFWDKIDYNSALTKDKIARCCHLPPIFGPGLCNVVM